MDKEKIKEAFMSLQDRICRGLEDLDGGSKFREEFWERPGGGGGRTRVITSNHIEKGGVNFSAVHGSMPEKIANAINLPPNEFFATGVSIVLHGKNPHVPIIHMNVRYFETSVGKWWFGGGIDMTPHYIIPEDARNFHTQMKEVCDKYDPGFYAEFKKWADDYFYIKHRDETRGIGGIFYDRLDESRGSKDMLFNFSIDLGNNFVSAYEKVFSKNMHKEHTDRDKEWQSHRRGRYVEFNLVWDRGTKFGLDTGGNIESILMSMPPKARWTYKYELNEKEKQTIDLLKKGIDWVNHTEV